MKWVPKQVKVTPGTNGKYTLAYYATLDKASTKTTSPRKSFDTELVDVVLYPTERQFTVHTYYQKCKYYMTFRAENEADYIKWSIYFRKQMDNRSVRAQVNVVEYRSTAILGVMMVLAVWTLLYLDEVVVMEFLNKYHKGLSLLCAGLIFVVFVNRFTSGAVADVINLIPFGVIENSMMFINVVILAIFTFFYDETFGSYFKNSCLTGDASAVAPAPGDVPIDA